MNLSCTKTKSLVDYILPQIIKPILKSLHSHGTVNLVTPICGFVNDFEGESKCDRAAGETHVTL